MQIFVVIFLLLLFVGGVGTFLFLIIKDKKEEAKSSNKSDDDSKDTNLNKDKSKEKDNKVEYLDSRDLLEYESLVYCNQDHSIIKINDSKYVGIIQVDGLSFNLLSRFEQLFLEEGFQSILNGLNFRCQLKVQTRRIEVEDSVLIYNNKVDSIEKELEKLDLIDLEQCTEEEKRELEKKMKNLYNRYTYVVNTRDYALNILLDNDLIEQKFYIVSDYDITNSSSQSNLKNVSEAYTNLYNALSLFIDNMPTYNLNCRMLDAEGLAEVIYYSINRDYSSVYTIKKAIKSIYSHLATTSTPVEVKRVDLEIELNNNVLNNIENKIEELKA